MTATARQGRDVSIGTAAIEDAEQSVIGAVFLRNDAYEEAELTVDDFCNVVHRAVWKAFDVIRLRNGRIDPVTVEEQLERDGCLKAVGGLTRLSEFVALVPTADNVAHYAQIVRDASLTRRVHGDVRAVLGSGLEANELLERLFEVLACAGRRGSSTAQTMAALVRKSYDEIVAHVDCVQRGERLNLGIATGLDDLDYALGGGLDVGVTSVCAGRPSDGKSAMLRTIADNATAAGWGCMYFSLEDRSLSLARRALADRSRINLQRLRAGTLDRAGCMALMSAANELHRRNNWIIDDARGLSMAQIAMRVRRYRQQLDPTNKGMLVVVDYLQRVRGRGESRRQVLEDAVLLFDDTCGTEGVAGLLGAQINRESQRENRRPALHDLGDTGALERAAATVFFVHHERNEQEQITRSMVMVAKNKHGARDMDVPLYWDAATTTFRNAVEPWHMAVGR